MSEKNELVELAKEIYQYQRTNEYWTAETADLPADELQEELHDLDDWLYLEDFDEKELRETIRKTVRLCDDIKENHLYNGYIQLSNNRTLWDIVTEIDTDEYNQCVLEAIHKFEAKTNVKVSCLGRNGKHICVEDSYENAVRFDELCNIQKSLEREIIDYFNDGESNEIDLKIKNTKSIAERE